MKTIAIDEGDPLQLCFTPSLQFARFTVEISDEEYERFVYVMDEYDKLQERLNELLGQAVEVRRRRVDEVRLGNAFLTAIPADPE